MLRSAWVLVGAAAAAPAALLALAPVAKTPGRPLARAPGCPVFPADNPWNQRVDGLPAAANSDRVIAAIGAGVSLHPTFGAGRYQGEPVGIPFTSVSRRQPRVRVRFAFPAESDRVRYPIPRDVPIEGGPHSTGDRHAIVVDRDRCRLYELYELRPPRPGSRTWRAGSGAVWDLRSNRLRPRGWTSADAAGLPILPGLARYDEVRRGRIDHALRFTVHATRRAFVYPARHYSSGRSDPDLPPMGLRVRLKASVDISKFPRQSRIVLTALKRYGMLVADNGGDWYVTGAPSRGWDDEDLHQLLRIRGPRLRGRRHRHVAAAITLTIGQWGPCLKARCPLTICRWYPILPVAEAGAFSKRVRREVPGRRRPASLSGCLGRGDLRGGRRGRGRLLGAGRQRRARARGPRHARRSSPWARWCCRREPRHHRRVRDAQALDAVDAQLGVDHALSSGAPIRQVQVGWYSCSQVARSQATSCVAAADPAPGLSSSPSSGPAGGSRPAIVADQLDRPHAARRSPGPREEQLLRIAGVVCGSAERRRTEPRLVGPTIRRRPA